MDDLYEKFLVSTGICTDSRQVSAGCLFVGIVGEKSDGNQFIEQALEAGASYVLTNRNDVADARIVTVGDTLATIHDLAALHRRKFDIPVVAIGGSNGKTTTKELISEVLAKKYRVLKTSGNNNNHIGVPLTLLKLNKEHEVAVVEIGANHPGEHASLMQLVQPTHALVTNNGLDHLEGFGSIEAVRKANAEIYDWMRTHNDDRAKKVFVDATQPDLVDEASGLSQVLYDPVSFSSSSNHLFAEGTYKGIYFTSRLAGSFNAVNMLAAIVVGEYFVVDLELAKDAIASYVPSLMRSEVLSYRDATWILDCYNANPSSMKVALESFSQEAYPKKGMVLGGMREMGEYSDEQHRILVERASSIHAQLLVFVGDEYALCTLPEQAQWFPDSASAKKYLDALDLGGFQILLKGSRGIGLEIIVGK